MSLSNTNVCLKLLVVTLGLSILTPHAGVSAQSKPAEDGKSPLCTREVALEMVNQQIDLTKTFTNNTRRIAVLLRAADLLWPYEQDKARAVFTDAFALATEDEQENEQKGPHSVILRMQVPDQRYVVIRAIAKRDLAWAKELIQQMLARETSDGDASPSTDSFQDVLTGEKLFDSAQQQVATDLNTAFALATTGLKYPASTMLTRFLYRLAEINQSAADQFYDQALAVYGERPIREFLYLAAYPFALSDSLDTPIFASYVVPSKFITNQSLQRRFVQTLLRRAQQTLEAPLDPRDTYRAPTGALLPGPAHLLECLLRLEPRVRTSLPDLSTALTQARETILVSLSPETQNRLLQPGREVSLAPEQTFDKQMEAAQKVPDVNRRDELIATLVLSDVSDAESLPKVIGAIDKISHSNVRAPLLELIHFRRATTAIKKKLFEEAEKLTAQVEGHQQRAFLHTEIARGLMKNSDTQIHAREVLEQAITEAKRSGNTIFSARTLLTISNLYTKRDLNRSIEVLADALNSINRIESPDFSADDQTLVRTVQRTGRAGQYVFRFPMPGLDLESAFRELARINFDTALAQSSGVTDKFQRAMSTLVLSEVCLEQAQQQFKEKPRKSNR